MTTIIQTQQVRSETPSLPAEVFIREVMPYVGFRKEIKATVRMLSKRHAYLVKFFRTFLRTIKWKLLTWKEAVRQGIDYEVSPEGKLSREFERSEEMMIHHETARDFIITLGLRVR